MKFDSLRSVGHNIADSVASGIGLMIGVYEMDVFGEASSGASGYVEIDFLHATTTGCVVSHKLASAVVLYSAILPELCSKQGVDLKAVKTLTATFSVDSVYGPNFSVTVENLAGKKVQDHYIGCPGRKLRRGENLVTRTAGNRRAEAA